MKKILIIGGDSFIARRFIRKFEDHYCIRAVSRVPTGFRNEIILDDFFEISHNEFSNHDVVVNFAAIVHQLKKIPEQTYFRINRDLALNIAEKAKMQAISRFIQMSTVAVYGRTENIDHSTPENPVTYYAKSKYEADKGLLKMAGEKFSITVLRPAMVYGGGNAPGNMMRLIKLVDKSIPLPFASTRQLRDFIHIDNLVTFINDSIVREINGICLLCDGIPVSVTCLAVTIARCLGKNIYLFSLPGALISVIKKINPALFEKLYGSLRISYSDITERFGFAPVNCLEEGIREMIQYYLKSKNKSAI